VLVEWAVPAFARPVQACQFLLEGFIEQFMPMVAEEHK